jgi:hypothetical protein
MKGAFKYISTTIILSIYLLASAGIGVHECRAKGTIDIVPLFSSATCESIHHHNYEKCPCGGNGGHHSEGCCKTDIHQLGSDYYNGQQLHFSHDKIFQFHHLFLPDFADIVPQASILHTKIFNFKIKEGPPLLTSNPYSYLSQWRL